MTYIAWKKPRHFVVKCYLGATRGSIGYHASFGVVAMSVADAIESAQLAYPEHRIESVNDCGEINLVCPNLPYESPRLIP